MLFVLKQTEVATRKTLIFLNLTSEMRKTEAGSRHLRRITKHEPTETTESAVRKFSEVIRGAQTRRTEKPEVSRSLFPKFPERGTVTSLCDQNNGGGVTNPFPSAFHEGQL